jgi:hypothetical protein
MDGLRNAEQDVGRVTTDGKQRDEAKRQQERGFDGLERDNP